MRGGDVFLHLDKMLDASRMAISFVEGMDESEFLEDGRTQSAVAMQLMVIGESVTRLERENPAFLAGHPEFNWRDMIGMRNRIAHGYWDLDFRVIWRTVKTDAPRLFDTLLAIYAASGESVAEPPRKD